MAESTNRLVDENASWKAVGFAILCVRFVQGFIYWGGGSRRFIYAPQKLDPYAAQWMANKLQSAMPGALLDTGVIISFLLQHFLLLYSAIILFSLAELFSGLALIFGCFTRTAGFITACLSVTLMLIFGWEGSTCVDEWTMAVSNLSMGLTLIISGSLIYSVDGWLIRRYPTLATKKWFVVFASGPLNMRTLKRLSVACFIFTIFFTLSTYDYYRGAIFSPYHPGPVSPTQFHLSLSEVTLNENGSLHFTLYVDAGNEAVPTHIMRIELLNQKGEILEEWSARDLNVLTKQAIKNSYDYNRITIGPYGLIAPMSAKAQIDLQAKRQLHLTQGDYQLQVYTIDGKKFSLMVKHALAKTI